MSADNGIYILKTSDEQYRVTHAQAIENIFYNHPEGQYNLGQLIRYFGHCRFTKSKEKAFDIANKMNNDMCTEYGVKLFPINMKWGTIFNKGIMELEGDAVNKSGFMKDYYQNCINRAKAMNDVNYKKVT